MRELTGRPALPDSGRTESSPGAGVEQRVVGKNYELGQGQGGPGGIVRTAGGSPASSDEILYVVYPHHSFIS